jgi:hypothetical protein
VVVLGECCVGSVGVWTWGGDMQVRLSAHV